MSEDRFLDRWSRMKRAETRQATRPDAGPEAPEAGYFSETDVPDPETISPEDLAALPPVDAAVTSDELRGYLRRGVPMLLRQAALRRMWTLSPAIRDYVDDAREYAYDWNVPGGAPGSGGELSQEQTRAMVAKLFHRVTGSAQQREAQPSATEEAARTAEAPVSRSREAGASSIAEADATPAVAEEGAGMSPDLAAGLPPVTPVREAGPRHGGARPA